MSVAYDPATPDDALHPNGAFFAFPDADAPQLVYLPVPWDATASGRAGTADGPRAILDVSPQLDRFDINLPRAWEVPRATVPIAADLEALNRQTRAIAAPLIAYQERDGHYTDAAIQSQLAAANRACAQMNAWVEARSREILATGALIGLVGGDHSVPLGLLRALSDTGPFDILHLDAHLDLRRAFEGFTYSHASIMFHAVQLPGVRVTSVGVRDVCAEEMDRADRAANVTLFPDWDLKDRAFAGATWAQQCEQIVETLGDRVYVSFDIDGLSPEWCPHAGTPVPGGLSFDAALYLVKTVVRSGREIVGFDLCEVAPGPAGNLTDALVGAHLLYRLSNLALRSRFGPGTP